MNIPMFFIAAGAGVDSCRSLLSSAATRTLLARIAFIDRLHNSSVLFHLVRQLLLKLAEIPIGQLLIDDFSFSLFRMALYAFHLTDNDFFHVVFQAPVHELPGGFVEGVAQLALAFSKNILLGPIVLFPLSAAFFASAHAFLELGQLFVSKPMKASHFSPGDDDRLVLGRRGCDGVDFAQVYADELIAAIFRNGFSVVITQANHELTIIDQFDFFDLSRWKVRNGDANRQLPFSVLDAQAQENRIPLDFERLIDPFRVETRFVLVRVFDGKPLFLRLFGAVSGEQILVAHRLYGLRMEGELIFQCRLQLRFSDPFPSMLQGIVLCCDQTAVPNFCRDSIARKQPFQIGLGSLKRRFETADHLVFASFP